MDGSFSIDRGNSYPQASGPRTGGGAKRVKQDHASDITKTKNEESPSDKVARRSFHKRKTIDINSFPTTRGMLEQRRAFIDKPNEVPTINRDDPELGVNTKTKKEEPPSHEAIVRRPFNRRKTIHIENFPTFRGILEQRRAFIDKPNEARTTNRGDPEPDLTTMDDLSQRGTKRARKVTVPASYNTTMTRPLLVQANQIPTAYERGPNPTSNNDGQPAITINQAPTTNERKILVPTRFSERLKKKNGGDAQQSQSLSAEDTNELRFL